MVDISIVHNSMQVVTTTALRGGVNPHQVCDATLYIHLPVKEAFTPNPKRGVKELFIVNSSSFSSPLKGDLGGFTAPPYWHNKNLQRHEAWL